jgi:hypothetical protein
MRAWKCNMHACNPGKTLTRDQMWGLRLKKSEKGNKKTRRPDRSVAFGEGDDRPACLKLLWAYCAHMSTDQLSSTADIHGPSMVD